VDTDRYRGKTMRRHREMLFPSQREGLEAALSLTALRRKKLCQYLISDIQPPGL